jgi:hypothetical protein
MQISLHREVQELQLKWGKICDHLEATIDEDIEFLAKSDTVATAFRGKFRIGRKIYSRKKIIGCRSNCSHRK